MAKRTVTGRKPASRRSRSRRSNQQQQVEPRSSTMRRERAGGRGFLAEARDMAQTVGSATLTTARGIGSGVQGAAKGVARGTQAAVGKVKDNRWPALLIGAGATWMVVEAVRGGSGSGNRGARRRSSSRNEPNVASRAASAVADAGRSIGGSVEQFVRDNPLLAGAATLGVGVAVAMALPSTRAESRMFGETRDAVLNKARESARGTIRNVQEVADRVNRLARGRG